MTRALLELKPSLRLDLREGAYLRPLQAADVTQAYVDGLNDPEINRHLEVRRQRQSTESVRRYVNENWGDNSAILFGIFSEGALQGTVRLHDVDLAQGMATVGIALFNRQALRKGLGSEALQAVVRFALQDLRLSRLRAGIVEVNERSIRTFEKAGFRRDGLKEPDPDLGTARWWVRQAVDSQ